MDMPLTSKNSAFANIQDEIKELFSSPKREIEAENLDVFFSNAPLTDTGNAECFSAKFGEKYRYVKTTDQWLIWNDICWKEDKTAKVDADILSIVRHRQSVAVSTFTGDPNSKVKTLNYLVRCENVRDRKNIKQASQWLPNFVTTIDQYDSNRYLVATHNGTLNLYDGTFYKSRHNDYITMQLNTNYDSNADCFRWKQFLKEIFNGDEELIRFMQKIVGHVLTGDTSEQKMYVVYGFGKNGKTVFLNTIQSLLGDYAGSASFKTFDADKQNEQTNDLAALKGKRFVSMSETSADKKLNESLIKQVTGGDRITCRFLYKDLFAYFPQFKLFLATNHKPVITQTDFGIWRRIVLIPFTQNFEGREETNLEEILKSELPGILNWAIEGLKLWQTEKLKPFPKAVMEATDKYKKDSDTIGQWLELQTSQDKSLEPMSSSDIKASVAYGNYKNWATENGYYPVGNRAFKSSLEEKGFVSVRRGDANYWIGLKVNSVC